MDWVISFHFVRQVLVNRGDWRYTGSSRLSSRDSRRTGRLSTSGRCWRLPYCLLRFCYQRPSLRKFLSLRFLPKLSKTVLKLSKTAPKTVKDSPTTVLNQSPNSAAGEMWPTDNVPKTVPKQSQNCLKQSQKLCKTVFQTVRTSLKNGTRIIARLKI